MNKILLDICDQLTTLKLDSRTVDNLNKFFKDLNEQLKGDMTTLLIVIKTDKGISTNLLSEQVTRTTDNHFKKLLIEYIMAFSDNKELLFDILELLTVNKVIDLSDYIRLELFNKLFNSGYFCYTPLDSSDFLECWDDIKYDMAIIGHILSLDTIDSINIELDYYLREFYMLELQPTLKELIL